MRMPRHYVIDTLFVTVSYLGLNVADAIADDSNRVSDAAVREAVSRSLHVLETDGVAWMRDRGCASCHHVPFLLWSHRAAQAHGLDVDATKLAEWDEWTRKDSLSHRNLYRLQNYDLGKVDPAMLPDAVKEKLKPLIELPFKTEEEFLTKLATELTEEEQKSYQAIVLKTAERTPYAVDRAGGGLDVLGQLLLGNQGTASVLTQPEFRDGVIELMNRIQLEDGSWTPGTSSRRCDAGRCPQRIRRQRCGPHWHSPPIRLGNRNDQPRSRKRSPISVNNHRIWTIENGSPRDCCLSGNSVRQTTSPGGINYYSRAATRMAAGAGKRELPAIQ